MPVPRIAERPRLRLWSRFLRRLLSGAVVEKRQVWRLDRDGYTVAADAAASGRCEAARPLRWQDCRARRRHGRAEFGLAMVRVAPVYVLVWLGAPLDEVTRWRLRLGDVCEGPFLGR